MNLRFKFISADELKSRIDEYIALFKTAFTAAIDKDIIYHRYLENPFGEFLMCAAEDADEQNRLVASLVALPTPVYVCGRVARAAIIMNIVTHPDYRGKGIFSSLMGKAEQELECRGYEFAYVFPHHTVSKTFTSRLGWTQVASIPTVALDISPSDYYSSFANPRIQRITCDETLWNPCGKICIGKTAEYIKWRYHDNAYSIYGFNGNYVILKRFNDELNIVELFADTAQNKKTLIGWVLDFASQNGFLRVSTFCSAGADIYEQLLRFGFTETAPYRCFAAQKLSQKLESDIYDYDSWNISMGDHNAY